MEPKNELQRNAIAEARKKELDSFQRALDIQWLDSRMEDGRMGRCLALIEREAEMEKDFQERTDHAAIVNARAEEEAKLGAEISKVRDEEVGHLMRRHFLRERDPCLRQLEKKLEAGYVCRDLKQQILDNEYRRMQDKVEESQANRVLLNALYNDMEQTEREELAKMKMNTQYCKDLQQQLVSKQRVRQCQYEDTLVEKKMQEGVMRTLADEDQREIQQKREATEKMRKEMVTFQQAREAWKQKQKEMVVLEEKKIEEQCQAASDRSSAIVAERQRKMQIREEQIEKMGRKGFEDAEAIQERMNIIRSLQEQEYIEKNIQDDKAKAARTELYRVEARQDRQHHLERRAREDRDQHEADVQFRKESNELLERQDEIEREKERKKKERNQQYSEDLRKQIEGNARRRKSEKERELKQDRERNEHDEAWRSEVQAEREKIVEEHVPHLLGHLQAGVVKHTDLPAVRSGARRGDLAALDIGSLSISSSPKRYSKCNEQCRVIREY